MGNVRIHRYIKLVTADRRRNQLASKPNFHAPKYLSKRLMAIEMKKKNKNKNE